MIDMGGRMASAFDLQDTTRIESGRPIAMHRQVGGGIAGDQFRLDVREYCWDETVVSSGTTSYLHILSAYADGRSHSACSFQRQGRQRQVPLGDIVFIPPHQKILIQSPPGYQRFLSLRIDPAMVPVMSSIHWTPDRLERALNIRHPRIRSLMSRLSAEVTRPAFASNVLVEGVSLLLAVELCRFLGLNGEEDKPARRLSKQQMEQIAAQVEQRQFAPSLAELAASCGISRRHLTRSFRHTTGITIGEFILDRQVARAKDLLAREDLLIKQVAYQCGFNSTAAFAAAFRRATGLTPTDFREHL